MSFIYSSLVQTLKTSHYTEILSGLSVRQLDVTHCVCALRCGGLFLPRRPLLLLLLGLFSTLCLLTLTAQRPQLLVLLRGKHLFGFMVVQVFLKPDGNGRGEDGAGSKMRCVEEEKSKK